jgi:hypothetical protein
MSVILVISACLFNGVCQDFNVPLQEQVTVSQCYNLAMVDMAKWSGDNPGWQISRWKCKEAKGTLDPL